MRQHTSWLMVLSSSLLLLSTCLVSVSHAYPIILTVDDNEDRCLQFNIPEDDDAHAVLLPLPDGKFLSGNKNDKNENEDAETTAHAVEAWYVQQLHQMIQERAPPTLVTASDVRQRQVIPRTLPTTTELPDQVAQAKSDFFRTHGGNGGARNDVASPVTVTVAVQSYEGNTDERVYKTRFFEPLVLNHLRKHHARQAAENYEGVQLCLEIPHDYDHNIHVLFDMIEQDEETEPLQPLRPGVQKEQHLTPLESSLDQSITAARQVLREYGYMEQREQRMRQTADGINARVHYFSYVSVGILFGVTYIQVGYLKRYFKKKKLM